MQSLTEPSKFIPTASSKIWIMPMVVLSSGFSSEEKDTFCGSPLGYFRGRVKENRKVGIQELIL